MAPATRSLNEILRRRPLETRAGIRPRSPGWKGQVTDNAPSRSIRRSGHPTLASAASRLRACDRDLICGEHYGQRPPNSAASKGRTHGSTDQRCIIVQKIPCQQGAVHTWLDSPLSAQGRPPPQYPHLRTISLRDADRHCRPDSEIRVRTKTWGWVDISCIWRFWG
jgi:hypothetical protein